MISPSLSEMEGLAAQGNVIPVHRDILGDLWTPASAFLRVAQGRRRVFLLESVEGGERAARYSFIGWDPFLFVRSSGEAIWVEERGDARKESGEPIHWLRSMSQGFRPVLLPDLPPFSGGGVGYFSYDLVRRIERLPSRAVDDLKLDDIQVMFFSTVLAFDHLRHRIHIIANVFPDRGSQSLAAKYSDAVSRIDQVEKRLWAPISVPAPDPKAWDEEPVSNMGRDEFQEKVRRAKEFIRAGDIFQVVLSHRSTVPVSCDPFDIYRALRFINPSPYMFYMRIDDLFLIGASPEMLVKVRGSLLEYGPIAGTRPRGANPEEDARLGEELLRDEKERAEHVMLVDLGRNDLGRVCSFGTVRVTDLMRVERYSHVMHLVSSIEGRLREGLDCYNALEACLPAGTVSGAPKVRAMEIIEELEPCRRGIYSGAVGYVDFSGNLDSCIALRTLVIQNGRAYIQAGAGIVADSDPAREWDETLSKARALVRSVQFAHSGLR